MTNQLLPYDVARCINGSCPKANNCLRYLARNQTDGICTTFAPFKIDDTGECSGFLQCQR